MSVVITTGTRSTVVVTQTVATPAVTIAPRDVVVSPLDGTEVVVTPSPRDIALTPVSRPIDVTQGGFQGPKGEPGANAGEPVTASYTSSHSGTLYKGQPVCVVSGQLKLASAQTNRYEFVGLVYDETIAPGASGRVQIDGLMVLPAAQWDVVLGTVGGLVAETSYYLQPGGNMAHTAPDTGGFVLVATGYAISSTEFMIEPGRPVFL